MRKAADCVTCARADWSKNMKGAVRCSLNSQCDYINIDDAVEAYEDREDGVLEKVVHCPDCMDCIEKGGHAHCDGYLYCKQRCRLVAETDYCSWGERR